MCILYSKLKIILDLNNKYVPIFGGFAQSRRVKLLSFVKSIKNVKNLPFKTITKSN